MRVPLLSNFALFLAFFSPPLAPVALRGQAPVETSNLSVASIRHLLAEARAKITAHPKEPQGHIDLAYTLVDAGATGTAVLEMRRAVELAPKAAFVYNAQGWVLTHNAIGVQYGKGYDYEAAAAAYRTAIALDATDLDARNGFAELLEYNRDGVKYAADAELNEAIEMRLYVIAHRGTEASSDEVDNLLITLFYSGRYPEVIRGMQGLAPSSNRDGIQLGALAALRGSEAAVQTANRISDEAKRRYALQIAADGLWNMRLYPQAADMLTASLPDPSGSTRLTGQIQIFRNLRPYRGVDLPPTDPRYPLQLLMASMITGTFSESVLNRCVSHHGFASEEAWRKSLAQANFLEGKLHTLARQTELPRVVIDDIVLNQLNYVAQPSRGRGARVMVQIPGMTAVSFFVVNEDGVNKIAAGDDLGSAGFEAFYLLNHQREEDARDLLDWKRERIENNQNDDPLGGTLFARLWQPGKPHDATIIKLAAASLIDEKATEVALLPDVLVLSRSSTSTSRDNLGLLLATMYLRAEDAVNANAAIERLLNDHPDSLTAVLLAGQSHELSKDWSGWITLLDKQLEQHPGNRPLLLQSVRAAELQGDFARARTIQHSLLDSGHALIVDQNNYAWLALFEDKPDEAAMEAAAQATLAAHNNDAGALHTLACLHAARGETALARQFLLDAMSAGGKEEPDSAAWYGFGRIYEQYGLIDAALDAYQRVEQPGTPEPDSTFVLAQRRVRLLGTRATN